MSRQARMFWLLWSFIGLAAADGLTTDSGESARGSDKRWRDAWPAHARSYQRDISIVENLARVGVLASGIRNGRGCSLMVGAIEHLRGTRGSAQVMAV